VYALIGTLYLGKHFVLRQGSTQGIQVPTGRFDELRRAAEADERVPDWLRSTALQPEPVVAANARVTS